MAIRLTHISLDSTAEGDQLYGLVSSECSANGIIGNVESLWRYPVKSMRGEEVDATIDPPT